MPLDVAMPMWPMKGNIHVIGGNGDHRMVNARGLRCSDTVLTVHDTSWLLDNGVAIASSLFV
eukprot:CAMPEP_0172317056 /NCGR_PEP_ID=MMETSP1058-20130122/30398_1 /TAXON_ID=83371 /ORGANISM="Detonula confervacea, Strain CCMP 353" /LENGTH=61 /DNA_ID=CAMNT_0013031511 /DNA_START=595 /DNA_END=777 /DNA_ORIENTATION=+